MLVDTSILMKPLTSIWQFFMNNKPIVTQCIQRDDPIIKLGPRDGFSYTIIMPDKSTREIFLMHEQEFSTIDYNCLYFVSLGSEGENFYRTPRAQRFTKELVAPEIRKAIEEFDDNSSNLKKNDLSGLDSGPNQPGFEATGLSLTKLSLH